MNLAVPSAADVADLLVRRDGIDPQRAAHAARIAQSHIGMARRLAVDEQAAARREQTVGLPLNMKTLPEAMAAAAEISSLAAENSKSMSEQWLSTRTASLRQLNGLGEEETVPPKLRGQFKALEDDAKRYARRNAFDALDRALIDLSTFFRDVLCLQLKTTSELVNEHLRSQLERYAAAQPPSKTLAQLDAIAETRSRLLSNVNQLVAFEALMTRLLPNPARR